MTARQSERIEQLPPPDRVGERPLEALLQARRSVRAFTPDTLTAREIGQLLWAAHGLTQTTVFAHHTIPSAGALYPLELYLLTARGVAHYEQAEHALRWFDTRDRRGDLAAAALQQSSVSTAPAVIVIVAEPQRTTVKYGERGYRYIDMECGCALQNVLLEAVALGLGGVPIGAFSDADVARVIGLPAERVPRLIVPVGHPR